MNAPLARVQVCCSITSCATRLTWEYTCIPDRGLCYTLPPTSYQTRLYTLDRDQQEQQRQLPNVDRQSQDPEQRSMQPNSEDPHDQWPSSIQMNVVDYAKKYAQHPTNNSGATRIEARSNWLFAR